MQAATARAALELPHKPGVNEPALVRCLTLQPGGSGPALRFFSVCKPKLAGKPGPQGTRIHVPRQELQRAMQDEALSAIIAQLCTAQTGLAARVELLLANAPGGPTTLSAAP